jgi:hypothetical protein
MPICGSGWTYYMDNTTTCPVRLSSAPLVSEWRAPLACGSANFHDLRVRIERAVSMMSAPYSHWPIRIALLNANPEMMHVIVW